MTEMTSKTARIAETVARVRGLRFREEAGRDAMEGFFICRGSRCLFFMDLEADIVLHERK